jgi:hypothetical protein
MSGFASFLDKLLGGGLLLCGPTGSLHGFHGRLRVSTEQTMNDWASQPETNSTVPIAEFGKVPLGSLLSLAKYGRSVIKWLGEGIYRSVRQAVR